MHLRQLVTAVATLALFTISASAALPKLRLRPLRTQKAGVENEVVDQVLRLQRILTTVDHHRDGDKTPPDYRLEFVVSPASNDRRIQLQASYTGHQGGCNPKEYCDVETARSTAVEAAVSKLLNETAFNGTLGFYRPWLIQSCGASGEQLFVVISKAGRPGFEQLLSYRLAYSKSLWPSSVYLTVSSVKDEGANYRVFLESDGGDVSAFTYFRDTQCKISTDDVFLQPYYILESSCKKTNSNSSDAKRSKSGDG